MVEYLSSSLDPVFHALGDATRRAMLRQLAQSPRSVTELAAPHDMSLAAASKHIKVLESAGLISREVQGRTHTCRLNAAPLASAQEWLSYYEKFWTSRLDALEALLKAEDAAKAKPKSKPQPKSK
ncbi:MAG: helix-turn-helix transcriptional regulator [Alphaproteobacteria bacterium]|nr:helix-turn-helix transcriptional regulator [Alphaproteobacteria bacterium]